MTLFRRLAVASTAATFLLVTIGGLVRATKSGLGCGTNWPDCPGDVNRALVIEFSHRSAAGIVVLLLGALAVVGFRHRAALGRLATLAAVAFGLVLFQAILGAIVVWLELKAESVVLHLATAMALLALLVYLTVGSMVTGRADVRPDRGLSRLLALAAASVLVVLLLGSFVTGTGAGDVFGDWPLMDGRVVPDLGVRNELVHFAHRLSAAAAGAIVFVASVRLVRSKDSPPRRRLGIALAALFALQVLVGAANVWSDLAAGWVALHLALGASIWAVLVGAVVVTHAEVYRSAPRELVERRPAALEVS